MKKNRNSVKIETKRPPVYTAMKYWGKKPHNIWQEYICEFCKEGATVLDPFAGCGMTAIEGLKANRNVIAFDINPLMTFTLDVFATKFDEDCFIKKVNEIIELVSRDEVYNTYYIKYMDDKKYTIQNFKWENEEIYEIGLVAGKEKKIIKSCDEENNLKKSMNGIEIKDWHPKTKISTNINVSSSFIKSIGGDDFGNIWTKRNLYILSKIFKYICNEKNNNIKLQLMYAFVQTVHLVSKMCVPRRDNANRPFSTSWGRPAYLCANRQMELNPLLTFKNNCSGKQSVSSSLSSLSKYFTKEKSFNNVNSDNCIKQNTDINYGIFDAKKLNNIIGKHTVDLIITDPPYGGLIQYCDLSYIWNIWLEKFDKKYYTDFSNEITIKKNVKTEKNYMEDLSVAIRNMYEVLKDKGKLIITFNSNDISVWIAFLNSIKNGGFKINRIVHQQNLRSSEANVANVSGISGTDYYLVCSKILKKECKNDTRKINIEKEIRSILTARNEETPINVVLDHFINILINNECDRLPENLVDIIKEIKSEDMYYCAEHKSFKLIKYDVRRMSLSEKMYNDMQVFKSENKTLRDIEIFFYKKYKLDLRPEYKQIKKIYNEVTL